MPAGNSILNTSFSLILQRKDVQKSFGKFPGNSQNGVQPYVHIHSVMKAASISSYLSD